MNWVEMLINVVAIFGGLGLYIAVMNSKFGRTHEQWQYAIMLVTIICACLIGGVLRVVVPLFM